MKDKKKLNLNKQTLTTIKTQIKSGAPVMSTDDACTTLECRGGRR